jgi:peptidoglycan hydrolase-like protein with peptidoglycan-binding domain
VAAPARPRAPPRPPPALSLGLGAPEPPQGVLLIAGAGAAALEAATDGLFGGSGVAEALAAPPEGVDVLGFRAPDAAFVPVAPAEAAPPPAREDAAEAPPPAPEAPAADPAEAAEAALGLDQAARRRIQEQLTVLGYGTRGIDGIFGPGTRAAVAEWQEAGELEPTGFLGAEQIALLRAQSDARSAELAAAAEAARREEEAADAAFWRTTGEGGSAADLRAYLGRYPDGIYAGEARAALAALEAEALEAAAAGDRAAWEAAAAEGDAAAYRRYLEANPEGAFVDQARARLAELEAEPARARATEAAAAAEEALGLNRGSRALIQGQLRALGYDVGEPDGSFNNRTRRALREFQTRQGLEVTGYVNQQTMQALIVASLGLR